MEGETVRQLGSGLILGALLALAISLLVSAYMAWESWALNPSALFHDETGTNWYYVFETAWSWLVPMFTGTLPVSAGAFLIFGFLSNRRRAGVQE